MHSPTIPFRLVSTQREEQLAQFNARKEIAWFGFRGAFKEPGLAIINFTKIESGLQGGGGRGRFVFVVKSDGRRSSTGVGVV